MLCVICFIIITYPAYIHLCGVEKVNKRVVKWVLYLAYTD